MKTKIQQYNSMEQKDYFYGAAYGFLAGIVNWCSDSLTAPHLLAIPDTVSEAFFAGIVGTLAGLITTQIWKWCLKKVKTLFKK